MSVRVNVKPLMHWLIHRHYTVRVTQRAAHEVKGIITTPEGQVELRYDPVELVVYLPEQRIPINEYGWELNTPGLRIDPPPRR
jgi:hypothetical protein